MFRGTVDLMDEATCPTVKTFFDSATVNYIRTQDLTNWGFDNLNYNVNLMLGDNDFVFVNARYAETNMASVVDCRSTTNVTSPVNMPYTRRQDSNTTSYSAEQGMMYRARMQMSWDGEWAMMISPYYYYGCGLSAYIVSVKNPRKMAYVNITRTDGGGAVVPSGTSGFKWLTGENTDSQPIRTWGIELAETGSDHTENFRYSPANYDYSNTPTTVANWTGNLNASQGSYSFQYPGYYYSTSYPRFMSVNYWPTQGTYQA
jgi:hypothetical protein